eukprot:134743-Amphidinium_carterae.1
MQDLAYSHPRRCQVKVAPNPCMLSFRRRRVPFGGLKASCEAFLKWPGRAMKMPGRDNHQIYIFLHHK